MEATEAAQEVARLYATMWRRFHVSRQAVPGADVTPRMLGVLQHLAAAGPLTISELAAHLRLSKAATTQRIRRGDTVTATTCESCGMPLRTAEDHAPLWRDHPRLQA